VRATVSKGASGGLVEESHADYYPFGSLMPGRNSSPTKYRHGYQGQFAEQNNVTGYNDFILRNYNSQTGRWFAPDPYKQHFSPYVGMGNNPVNGTDPDGGKYVWVTHMTLYRYVSEWGIAFGVGAKISYGWEIDGYDLIWIDDPSMGNLGGNNLGNTASPSGGAGAILNHMLTPQQKQYNEAKKKRKQKAKDDEDKICKKKKKVDQTEGGDGNNGVTTGLIGYGLYRFDDAGLSLQYLNKSGKLRLYKNWDYGNQHTTNTKLATRGNALLFGINTTANQIH